MGKILITRQAEQAEETAKIFFRYGINVKFLPLIKTVSQDFDLFYESYDLALFTSPNAVLYYALGGHAPYIGKYLAIGKRTAECLSEKLSVPLADILLPDSYNMASILDKLKDFDLKGKKVLSPGAKVRVKDVSSFFREKGGYYEAATVYSTEPLIYDNDRLDNILNNGDIAGVAFFSPSTVDSFFQQHKSDVDDILYFSIGDTTTKKLEKYGVKTYTSKESTVDSMAELIKNTLGC